MRRIGQILSECVPLSAHDVAEILEEQKVSRQRFGDAALALGLAQPEQVWHAWIQQLQGREAPNDVTTLDLDPSAARLLTSRFAVQHRMLPIRSRGEELVVAVDAMPSPEVAQKAAADSGKRLIFIRATSASLTRGLQQHYPAAVSEAA